MQNKKLISGYFIFIIIISIVATIPASAHEESIPIWNTNWSYRQEILIPIDTSIKAARYQPIDIPITFDNDCWTINEKETSIRVVCWDGTKWDELESQIYNINPTSNDYIDECNLVFLIPGYVNGQERYFIYYDDNIKSSLGYEDHITVVDEYYSSTPIADVSAVAQYYGIIEDGYYVYGIGQEGELLNRCLSQVVIKQKHKMKEFDALDVDQIASYGFSYYYGDDEKDEAASDQIFVSKDILVDGNLMTEFIIVSESKDGNLRTTAVYKYFYSPVNDKRICVHVKHEVLNRDVVVSGKKNIDGRFGALLSFESSSVAVEQMNTGKILPYLHYYNEDNIIEEYPMILNPESKEREWILSVYDDADLGSHSWVSYDEGEQGKAHGMIFSSNKNIIQSGENELDGIQVKAAEKEYFNFLGTEVDYVSITFGRNSYEPGNSHDVEIPKGFVAEFDSEFFTSDEGGYQAIDEEASIYQTLIKQRQGYDNIISPPIRTYNLMVFPHFAGTRFTFPMLANKTDLSLPVNQVEIYQNNELVESGFAKRILFHRAAIRFHDLPSGEYLVKNYWYLNNDTRFYTGYKIVDLQEDTKIHILCNKQRKISVNVYDQNGKGLADVELAILEEKGTIISNAISDENGAAEIAVPQTLKKQYILKATYKGIIVYEEELSKWKKNIEIPFDLYDVTIEIRDKLGLKPGVSLSYSLLNRDTTWNQKIELFKSESGIYSYKNLPASSYIFQISYGNFIDEKVIDIPNDGNKINIQFTATFNLKTSLFDSRGNKLNDNENKLIIKREGKDIYNDLKVDDLLILPPGEYTVNAQDEKGKSIGIEDITLTSDRAINIVTTNNPIYPTIILIVGIILTILGFILTAFHKISFSSLLKMIAVSCIFISIVQPWWGLSGSIINTNIEHNTNLFLTPPAMIETINNNNFITMDLALIPDVFISFLQILLILIYATIALIYFSIILKKNIWRKSNIFISISCLIVLIIILAMFTFGMSTLCEVSVGTLQGNQLLEININGDNINIPSQWGLGIGFYLCLLSIFLFLAGIILETNKFSIKKLIYRK